MALLSRNDRSDAGQSCPSPVVVRSDSRDKAKRAAQLEAELAPVIGIMNRTGITAAGFKVTGAREIDLNRNGTCTRALADRLASARQHIRAEADRTIGVFALPDALLYLPGGYDAPAVSLLGDDKPGSLWEHPVILVAPAGR